MSQSRFRSRKGVVSTALMLGVAAVLIYGGFILLVWMRGGQ